jgi:hypothetical protein
MALRNSVVTLVLGISATLALVACKGTDPAGAGGSGGSGGQPTMDAPVVLPPTSNGDTCQDGSSSCADKASVDAYSSCVLKTCDPQYKQCFGADYTAGNFGGDCADLMVCASACKSCDQTCIKACTDKDFTGACKSCITGPIFDCVLDAIKTKKCTLPCGPSSSGGVCDQLKTCCDSLSAEEQPDCNSAYDTAQLGGDQGCQSVLYGYKQGGSCM